jgi:hypothetical protein
VQQERKEEKEKRPTAVQVKKTGPSRYKDIKRERYISGFTITQSSIATEVIHSPFCPSSHSYIISHCPQAVSSVLSLHSLQ